MLNLIRGLIRIYRISHKRESVSDRRTPYERFMAWLEQDTGKKATKMDRMAFGLLFNFIPFYLKAMFWATLLGFIFLKIYDKWGIGKLVISIGITLYLKIHFSVFMLERKIIDGKSACKSRRSSA